MWWSNSNKNNLKKDENKWKEDHDGENVENGWSSDNGNSNSFPADSTTQTQGQGSTDIKEDDRFSYQQQEQQQEQQYIDDNNTYNDSTKEESTKSEQQEQMKILSETIKKTKQSHLFMWIVSTVNGIQAGAFFGAAHFVGYGIIWGSMSGQLFQKDFLKSKIRTSLRDGYELGTFVFLYNGFENSIRIARKQDVSSNHFAGGFLAGAISSATVGFSAYADSPNMSQLKADPSGVFKQYKPRRTLSKHLISGLMLGTAMMAWDSFTRSSKEAKRNNASI